MRSCIFIFLVWLPLHLFAVEKPLIALRVALNDPFISGSYPNIPELERMLGERIARHLNEEVPIFRFELNGVTPSVLLVDFDRDGSPPLDDLDFRLTLTAVSPLGGAPQTMSMRGPCQKYIGHSSLINKKYPGQFINDLEEKFKTVFLRKDMIDKLFSSIVIENFAMADFKKKQWRLKCTHEEVKMGPHSEFIVIQEDDSNLLIYFLAQVASYREKVPVTLVPRSGEADPTDFVEAKCKFLRGIQIKNFMTLNTSLQPSSTYP